MVNEVIVDQLTRLGARVLTADGADLTSAHGDPTRTLIRQVLGAVAQFEKSVIVLKLRAARDRIRRRDGRCEGRKPFGSRPSEPAGAEWIRQLRRKRKGRHGSAWPQSPNSWIVRGFQRGKESLATK